MRSGPRFPRWGGTSTTQRGVCRERNGIGEAGQEVPREASAMGQAGQILGLAAPGCVLTSRDMVGGSPGQGEKFIGSAMGANTFPL